MPIINTYQSGLSSGSHEMVPGKMVETFGILGRIHGSLSSWAVTSREMWSQIHPEPTGSSSAWRNKLGLMLKPVEWEIGASATTIQAQENVLKANVDA
ncbi:hypothetical protein PM082_007828 [Marasmius tenuissimus]|nr:hypothetical protein PM082_007828 [Marasmius tenuissimus]